MLQEWTSSKYNTFMERGLNDAFFPGRNMGVMAEGNAFDKNLFWQLGGFQDTNDQGFAFDEWGDGEYDLSGRLVGTPVYSEDGSKVLHLGVDYIHRFRDSSLRYRQRPESHLAQRLVDTRDSFLAGGDITAADADIVNLELAGVLGPFSVQTEWTYNRVNGGSGQPNLNLWGGYAFASWFLTGEHRNYGHGQGRFNRVKPTANFNPAKGDWGAWELAARYSYLDLGDENISGGRLWDATVGLNWYLFPNLRWMLNYVHGDVNQRTTFVFDDMGMLTGIVGFNGAVNILQTRFQLDF